jgi:putative selenate reductase
MVAIAGVLNTKPIVERATEDPRYAAAKNRAVPKKVGSRLVLFDCVSCHKCVPVCPNDANFRYDVEPVEAEYAEVVVTARGPAVIPRGVFRVARGAQWATFHDFCNECGNCDVFCPEDGGPFVEKPRFFSSEETYRAVPGYDGFLVERRDGGDSIRGRVGGREYVLRVADGAPTAVFGDGVLEVDVEIEGGRALAVRVAPEAAAGHALSLREFFVFRTLLRGVLDPRRANYLNAARA